MCLRMVPKNPELKIAIKAVKTCSKAISAYRLRHSKSPCFSQATFLLLVGPEEVL